MTCKRCGADMDNSYYCEECGARYPSPKKRLEERDRIVLEKERSDDFPFLALTMDLLVVVALFYSMLDMGWVATLIAFFVCYICMFVPVVNTVLFILFSLFWGYAAMYGGFEASKSFTEDGQGSYVFAGICGLLIAFLSWRWHQRLVHPKDIDPETVTYKIRE